MRALDAVTKVQALHKQTFAVHGAAFVDSTKRLVALREDVGRHNALDKASTLTSETTLNQDIE